MITAAQLRAARGLVDWTRNELAKAANISPETVKNIEHGIFRPQEETAERIVRTFKAQGVEFTDNEGVRLYKDSVVRYEGVEGFKRFIDDVYEEAKQPYSAKGGDKPMYISNVDDRLFGKYLGEYFAHHVQRMNALKNITMHILIQERPTTLLPEESRQSYREYRKLAMVSVGNVPFYVYGDKLGILTFEGENAPQIVVLHSALAAKAYREQFDVMWAHAEVIEKVKKAV